MVCIRKIQTVVRVAILVSASLLLSTSEAHSQDRLRLDRTDPPGERVELEGTVAAQNKYSIDVLVDGQTMKAAIDKRTEFILVFSGPRIDFEKLRLTVPVKGAQRKYRNYRFEEPLFLQAAFVHKNQFQRFIKSEEKRIGNFQIGRDPFETTPSDKRIFLTGKLRAGPTHRKQTLDTGDQRYQVLLAKNGRWSGFGLQDLTAHDTAVRITGSKSADDHIKAERILFWPIQSTDQAETKKADE